MALKIVADYIVQLLAVFLSWPVAVLVIAYWFRAPIRAFLANVKRAKAAGVELEMDRPQQTGSGGEATVNAPLAANTSVAVSTATTTFRGTTTTPDATPPAFPATADYLTQIVHRIRHAPEIVAKQGDEREELMARAFADKLLALSFERTYRNIFGSQIEALVLANSPGGTSIESLRQVFDNAKARFPAAHADRTFEAWLDFLKHDGKIEEIDGLGGKKFLTTTPQGKEFLHYMVREGLQPKPG